MGRTIREKYKIPDKWTLTLFKRIKINGWFRNSRSFFQKTSLTRARKILSGNTYSFNVVFYDSERVMTFGEEIDRTVRLR